MRIIAFLHISFKYFRDLKSARVTFLSHTQKKESSLKLNFQCVTPNKRESARRRRNSLFFFLYPMTSRAERSGHQLGFPKTLTFGYPFFLLYLLFFFYSRSSLHARVYTIRLWIWCNNALAWFLHGFSSLL